MRQRVGRIRVLAAKERPEIESRYQRVVGYESLTMKFTVR